MGFVDSLRMQRIFPGDHIPLGYQGKIPDYYGGRDPFDDIVGRFKNLQNQQTVTPQVAPVAEEPQQQQQQSAPRGGGTPRILGPMTDYQQAQIAERQADRASREANQQANRGIATERLGLQRWRAENPNAHFDTDETGEIIMFNPQSGAVQRTGVRSSDLPDREMQQLVDERQDRRINQQFQNQSELQRRQQQFTTGRDQTLMEGRGWTDPEARFDPQTNEFQGMQSYNRFTGQTRPAGGGTTRSGPIGQNRLLPGQQLEAWQNHIRGVINRNPQWESLINPITGAVRAPFSSWMGGEFSEEERNRILQEIGTPEQFGSGIRPPQQRPQSQNTQPYNEQPFSREMNPVPSGRPYLFGNRR